MYLFSLNRIQRPNKDGKTEVIPARTVFEGTNEKFKELEGLGAARKATTEEIDVYKARQARASGQSVATNVTDSTATAETASTDTGTDAADSGKATTSTSNAASAGTGSTTGKGQPAKSAGSKSSTDDMIG
jgi:hypothetical protein